MADLEWKPFEDGEVVTTAGVNDRKTAIQQKINDLGNDAIHEQSLNRDHLPTTSKAFDGTARKETDPVAVVTSYAHTYPGWPTDVMAGVGWDQVPIGRGDGRFEWRTDIPNSQAALDINYNTTAENGVDQVLVLANIHVVNMIWLYPQAQVSFVGKYENTGSAFGSGNEGEGVEVVNPPIATWVKGNVTNLLGLFLLCMEDSSGNLYPVPKTLRYIDSDTNTNSNVNVKPSDGEKYEIPKNSDGTGWDHSRRTVFALPRIYKDVAIRSVIRKSDILPHSKGATVPDQFVGVRWVASVLLNHSKISSSIGTLQMKIRESRISAMAPRLGTGTTVTDHAFE